MFTEHQNVCLKGKTVTDLLENSHLSVLSIKGQDIIKDSEISHALNYCKSLKSLVLHECLYITDNGLEIIAINCPQLENLELSECNRLTIIGIKRLVRSDSASQRILSSRSPARLNTKFYDGQMTYFMIQ